MEPQWPTITSLRGAGRAGTLNDSIRESAARPEPTKNTAAGEKSQSIPNKAGRKTAAIWLIVKPTPAVAAISAGSAIF